MYQNGPKTVTSGLVLHLDAANPKSYPGSGASWKNLANENRNAIINGTPTFTSSFKGAITTPPQQTATYIELPESVLQALPYGFTWTMEWLITILSYVPVRYGPHMTVGGGNDFIWMYNSGDSQLYAVAPSVGTNPTWTQDVPMRMSLTRNESTWRIYKNGIFAAEYNQAAADTKTINAWIADQEQDGVKTAFDPNQNLNANWHQFLFYDRILYDAEILQNFNATRGRFGL